jgi:hypothetical protein
MATSEGAQAKKRRDDRRIAAIEARRKAVPPTDEYQQAKAAMLNKRQGTK